MLKVAICQPNRLMVPKIMELLQISQCKRDLNFSPLTEWPAALPAVAWKSQLLCGFSRQEGTALTLDCEFQEAISSIYSELSFAELARLYSTVDRKAAQENDFQKINWEKLFSFYRLRFDRNVEMTIEKLILCPNSFVDWCAEKSIGPRELGVLRAIDDEVLNNNSSDFHNLLIVISENNPSKNLGANALDLGCEILLMGHALPSIEEASSNKKTDNSFDLWLKKLKETRFPMSTENDASGIRNLNHLPWPKKSTVQWVRNGDRAGISFQTQIFNVDELAIQSAGMQRVLEEIQKDPQKLWKN